MNIMGLSVTRAKAAETALATKAAGEDLVTRFPAGFPMGPGDGWWTTIRESFTGAWQRNLVARAEDALTHPTFWACVTLIGGDIAKGGFNLVKEDDTGITTPVDVPAFSPVLRKPNHYQNRIQFYTYWILSKLCRGNTYVLKERDGRKAVTAMYLLDPTRVRPLVGPDGDVYYSIGEDTLSGIGPEKVIVPASEIIHDLMNPLYHPLCGLSPVYACGHPAGQALKIMSKSSRFFANDSMLGGLLVAPGQISADTAKRLEDYWNANYAGEENIGKIAAIGDGLQFEKPNKMSAIDAQLIDQLKWDDEKICSTFHVPQYMVGVGAAPNYNNIESLNQQYYSQCLQVLIESMELCLEEGLGVLEAGYQIEFDLEALLRMDSVAKMDFYTKGVKGGIFTPNFAGKKFNRPPLPGGDTVYLQEQDHSLEWLSRRDSQPIAAPPQPAPAPAQSVGASPTKSAVGQCVSCGRSSCPCQRQTAGMDPCPVDCETCDSSCPCRTAGKASGIDSAELLDVVMRGLAA